tara:strand:- start:36 stop:1343 length:1308 start_codon:yes stop_codon:yes gene_type:complete
MGGGIMQLIVSGRANKHITGNPETTHFKSVYFRHTNFAMESVPCIFNNAILANAETSVVSTIQRSGDLVAGAHIEFILTRTFSSGRPSGGSYVSWTNATGYALIKEVSLEIENQVIDKHYSEWFDIWNELTDTNNNEHLLVNKHEAKHLYLKSNDFNTNSLKCYVPLQFYFCRNPGLALPLIALQNQKLYMKFTFRNPYTLINTDHTSGNIGTISYTQNPELYIDYIYLDTAERRSFSKNKHQYLIEQVQFNGYQTLSSSNEINFDNPIKELIWVCRNKNVKTEKDLSTISNDADAYSNTVTSLSKNNDYFNYMSVSSNSQTEYLYNNNTYEPFKEVDLIINGNSRFNKRYATYFRTIQPKTHHSKIPNKHIYLYSFSLNPEKHQPSGVLNFSKLKSVKLNLTEANTTNMELLVFAVNYNLLRIVNGMGGLAYTS